MSHGLVKLYRSLLDMYGPQAWWPGEDPFEVMIGAILTQNTQWSNVEKALERLKQKGDLSPESLIMLPQSELEQCLKPSGYFRVKAQRLRSYCHWYCAQGGYEGLQRRTTPQLRALLLALHGIGPETADDILLYAFGRPVFVIDAYTRRLLERLSMTGQRSSYEEFRSLFESGLESDQDWSVDCGELAWFVRESLLSEWGGGHGQMKRVYLYQQFHALIVTHAKQRCRKHKPDCCRCALLKCCTYSSSSSS